jgi:uncharacterized repeat protein (TIGR03803 family)
MRALNVGHPKMIFHNNMVKSILYAKLCATALAIMLETAGAMAQSVQSVCSFSFTNGPSYPYGKLALGPDGSFYGTTYQGGISNLGTVFKVTTNGTLTELVSFVNTNGAHPYAGLTFGPDGNFYGTTLLGGSGDSGTIFKVTTNGALTAIYAFSTSLSLSLTNLDAGNSDGAAPYAGVTLGPDGNFYGTTFEGGTNNYGTVFRVTTNGDFTNLVNFDFNNGANPVAGLTLGSDGNLYGATEEGGTNGCGTVFWLATNGVFTTLVSSSLYNGADPSASLTLGPDGNLYGTTPDGVFQVTVSGALATVATVPYAGSASLTLGPDGNFYGTAYDNDGGGSIFRVTTNGPVTVLEAFPYRHGAGPAAPLTLGLDGNFYGTTLMGGPGLGGEIFRLNLPPTIPANPASQPVSLGQDAIVTVSPFGTAPFAYQWLSNGVAINGATESQLTVSNVTAALATNAQFQVVITNAWGGITSSVATIDLLPVITTQPADQTQVIGGTVAFAASAVGNPRLAYQWYFNQSALGGATSADLTVGPVSIGTGGGYQLIVTNIYGSATSRLASLTVLLQPNSYAVSSANGGNMTVYLAGVAGSTNRLWTTTNLGLPMTQWQVISTNVMNMDGFSQFTDTNAGGSYAQRYYRLSMP